MKIYSFKNKYNLFISDSSKCFITFAFLMAPLLIAPVLITQIPFILFSTLLISGWLCWTFAEYMIHRFLTHTKSGESSNHITRHMHHHSHPSEIKISSFQRALIGVASFALFALAIFWYNYFTILAGIFISFSYSFFSHWMLHQKWSQNIFPRLFHYHVHHHCKYPNKCFGFSTTFWDRVFKTAPPEDAYISDRIIRFYYGELEKHLFLKNKNMQRY